MKFRSLKWAAAKIASRCEKISQPSRVAEKINFHCETISQPPSALCENFYSCEETPWHTSAISQPSTPVSQLQNHPLAHECHFTAPYARFVAVKWVAKMMLKFPLLRKRPAAAKSTPPHFEKSRLLQKGTVTLGVPFKRYKFPFSYSNRSFELQKGTKMSQARAPSRLSPPPEQATRISDHFR